MATDLRLISALLHVMHSIERMGDQCVNIAKLVPLSGYEAPKDKDILDAIERMGQLARSQVSQAKEAFASRNVEQRVRAWHREVERGAGHRSNLCHDARRVALV